MLRIDRPRYILARYVARRMGDDVDAVVVAHLQGVRHDEASADVF